MGNPALEDIFRIKNGGFPLLSKFTRGYIEPRQDKTPSAGVFRDAWKATLGSNNKKLKRFPPKKGEMEMFVPIGSMGLAYLPMTFSIFNINQNVRSTYTMHESHRVAEL